MMPQMDWNAKNLFVHFIQWSESEIEEETSS